jgi:four helix bundle suffix protein
VNAISLDPAPFADDMVHESAKHALQQRKKYARWLDADDAVVVANAMLIIIGRALNMLKSRIKTQGKAFEETGGFSERLTAKRIEAREKDKPPSPDRAGPADAAYADQGMAISPDGAILAVVDENTHAIQLFDVKAGKATTLLKGHTDGVYTIAFSPEGSLLASASYDKTVRLWDVKKGTQVVSLAGHKQGTSAVIFSPNGAFLASADLGGDVILWGVPVK